MNVECLSLNVTSISYTVPYTCTSWLVVHHRIECREMIENHRMGRTAENVSSGDGTDDALMNLQHL